jgi:hypothetical protein
MHFLPLASEIIHILLRFRNALKINLNFSEQREQNFRENFKEFFWINILGEL